MFFGGKRSDECYIGGSAIKIFFINIEVISPCDTIFETCFLGISNCGEYDETSGTGRIFLGGDELLDEFLDDAILFLGITLGRKAGNGS